MAYGQRKLPLGKLKELLDTGISQRQAAKQLGFSEKSVCQAVKKLNRLTKFLELPESEQTFIKALAGGASQGAAAAEAFECSSPGSARAVGCQHMQKPEVKAAFAEWMAYKGMGREQRAEKLIKHIEDEDPSVSLRALEIGMKAASDFPDPKLQVEKREFQYVVSFSPMGTPIEEKHTISIERSPDFDTLYFPETQADRDERDERHESLSRMLPRANDADKGE